MNRNQKFDLKSINHCRLDSDFNSIRFCRKVVLTIIVIVSDLFDRWHELPPTERRTDGVISKLLLLPKKDDERKQITMGSYDDQIQID